ncbi:D-3-phosphoglycerate dehydrogenase [Acetomicrobium thermoterrenum DSM 13490]|uniref:D-3-phosphoglycerate dehydrogenase n=2 Tax=Acetomicrobium TaxID=49894 RepID=A0A1H3GCM8_9BACT|nr:MULTISPECIES: 2-hydroxyacid dehydrogenase [Acetomicrobium]KRT35449.1 putative glyoxylate reductase [Acetomicrobium hydrogeniformans ATCC BAA-1850]SDY01036.1 D-3-phosphoglycerate dehydrogenase [Acetomicrobium thermoterrenum DSM 13490]
MKFLVVGDGFVKSFLFVDVFRKYFPDAEFVEHEVPWPNEPFYDTDEVKECSGTPDELMPLVKDADVLVVDTAPVTEALLQAASKLKAVACTRGGPVNVNIKACTSMKIPLFNSPGRNESAVVEFTVGATLALMKNMALGHYELKRGIWRGDLYLYDKVGPELSDLTVGIVGYGKVGRNVAKMFSLFGCQVLVYDPYVTPSIIEEEGHKSTSFEELLKTADVVSLHVRLSPETEKMMDGSKFNLMKSTSYFVNTARGGIVDYDALYEALAKGKIKGAALDVFDPEPLPPDHPLTKLDNVLLTPHIAGASQKSAIRGIETVAGSLYLYFDKGELKNCVNKEIFS